jgi:hypothetical protein
VTFDAVLEQALEMLRRRGRVSYRALQVQFQLDDTLLEILKDEIVGSESLRALLQRGDPVLASGSSTPCWRGGEIRGRYSEQGLECPTSGASSLR